MQLSQAGGIIALQAYCNAFDNATLQFFGAASAPGLPATPETANANTLAATFTFTAGAFATPTFSSGTVSAVANFTTATVTPVASNAVGYARAELPSASAWTGTHSYTSGNVVTNSGNTYVCINAGTSAASGGPTTTGTGIPDGTTGLVWMYIGNSSSLVSLGDFSVGTSGTDIIVGSTAFNTGVQVNLSSFKLTIPAV